MPSIDSRSHPALLRFRAARDGKDRQSIFAEGPRLAVELMQADWPMQEFLYGESAVKKPQLRGLVEKLQSRGVKGFCLSARAMEFVSDLETPPGLIIRAQRPAPPPWSPALPALAKPAPLLVVLDQLQSPANLGAVLRAAEAAGADAVIALPGTVDPWGPKALRGSAGSALRLPILAAPSREELVSALEKRKIPLVMADARGASDYWSWDWKAGAALVLGPERGFSGWDGISAHRVRIPMAGRVESLNVAVAAGTILLEAYRQRRIS